MDYPSKLLEEVLWAFAEPLYDDYEAFYEELKTYYEDVQDETFPFEKDEIVFNHPEIVVQYQVYDEEDEDDDERLKLITSDNGKYFTLVELMFKLHQEIGVELFEDEHHFFEGLTFATDDDPEFPQKPVYFLILGS